MPKWGLTSVGIGAGPWDLDENWLQPCKVVTDPVHQDIYLNVLETRLVDSAPMQRLRGVRQLGTAHLIYPGATHTRFSHALGSLRAAQNIMDAVAANRDGPRPADDLFKEWSTSRSKKDGLPSEYDRRWAEVVVLARLGALLHDLCHVPFGHTIEDDLKVLTPHDANITRFQALWSELPRDLLDLFEDRPRLKTALLPLIISKDPGTHKPFDVAQNGVPVRVRCRRQHHLCGSH